MKKARPAGTVATLKEGIFSEGFDALRNLALDSGFSEELSAAIRKGGASRAIKAMNEEFGIGRKPLPWLLPMIIDSGVDIKNVSDQINERNFPLDEEGPYDASGLALFESVGREWSIGEVWEATRDGGKKFRRLEGLVRGLAYLKGRAATLLSSGPIVFPASAKSVPCSGEVFVPYAGLIGGKAHLAVRHLRLGEHLPEEFRFLISINKRK